MKELTPEEKHVFLEGGTEAPFSGAYVDTHDAGMLGSTVPEGVYRCKQCGNVLFSSDAKFDSGTGWPSFTDPAVAENVGTRVDNSHGVARTEVYCKNCGGHLGHVFDDGPIDRRLPAGRQGKRYCINSVCLNFEKEK